MSHTCHTPGCKRQVPPKLFACKMHWSKLPSKIQDAIWREYRAGQENDKRPSWRYLAVQRLACAHLAFKPDSEEAALEVLRILGEAEHYRRIAVAQGHGDPLEGLVTPSKEKGKKS